MFGMQSDLIQLSVTQPAPNMTQLLGKKIRVAIIVEAYYDYNRNMMSLLNFFVETNKNENKLS